jgi:DNA mismatch endonuclease (patch repair protein)
MVDVVDKKARSRMMAGIRGKDTRPELVVRRHLHQRGFRFRLHARVLPGRPDIVLPKWKVAIQVNGCFWHGHTGCPRYRIPTTRRDFWLQKIQTNRYRDRRALKQLSAAGWRVAVVWECSLIEAPESVAGILEQFIRGAKAALVIGSSRKGSSRGRAEVEERSANSPVCAVDPMPHALPSLIRGVAYK